MSDAQNDTNDMNAAVPVVFEETFKDAIVINGPYRPEDYPQSLTFSFAKFSQAKNWQPKTVTVSAFVSNFCEHLVGDKDGLSVVMGDMVPGQRLKNAVKTLEAVGIDLDSGVSGEKVDAVLEKLGVLAIRYTTHSHAKTKTEFKKDRLIKFLDTEEITTEGVQRFLREQELWEPAMIESAEYLEDTQTNRGILAVIGHRPFPKHRVIVPLAKPFVIAKEARTQEEAMKKWGKVPTALAGKLGVTLDKACLDPSRLFYTPRHAKQRAYEIRLFVGPLFDFNTLQLDSFEDQLAADIESGPGKSTNKSTTPEGRALGRWWMGRGFSLQLADLIEDKAPDKIRGNASSGFDIECPFDEYHSNPGDPDDRACFAVNAGDGTSENVMASCRHEACRERTTNDHVGKMIKDRWFERADIENEDYLSEKPEDGATGTTFSSTKKAASRKDYKGAIKALTKESSEEEVYNVVEFVLLASLSSLELSRAKEEIGKNIGENKTTVGNIFAEAKRFMSDEHNTNLAKRVNGRSPFSYSGSYHFDEACDFCVREIQREVEANNFPSICQMDGQAMKTGTDKEGKLQFQYLSAKAMWSYITSRVSFVDEGDKKAAIRQKVPEDVAYHVYEQSGNWLREAPEVVHTPVYLRNGSLLVSEGYHYDANDPLFLNHYVTLDGLTIPEISETVSKEEALASLNWLRTELLSDFPFLDTTTAGVAGRDTGEANALAMILTPFMRRMISGRTPLFMISKPSPGTGASQLGTLPQLLFDGEAQITRYTSNEEEMSKVLIAAIQVPRMHLFFDDVTEFNNRELIRPLTSEFVTGRLLGASKTVKRPNTFNWIATGNNPLVKAEMERRTCWIRLNAQIPIAAKRKFRHPDISGVTFDDFVLANRGKAIANILTLIEYWISSGGVPFKLRKRSGFDDWCEKVGGVLQAVGVEGFLDYRVRIARDATNAAEINLVKKWLEKSGLDNAVSPSDLYDLALGQNLAFLTGANPDVRWQNFQRDLRRIEGRVFDGNNLGVKGTLVEVALDDADGGASYILRQRSKSDADAEGE